jgi:alpha-1,6-mannosyltransferase
MPIRTLHITNYYHATSGGIRTFYRALLEAANVHRREVRLIVPGPEQSVENVGDFGRIYTIAAPRSPFFDPRYRLLFPHLYALPYRSAFKKILSAEQPDLVEICDKYTLCYLPSVLRKGWVCGMRPSAVVGLSCERMDDNISAFVSSGKAARRFSGWYMKRIYGPRFDHHISNSAYTAEELRKALAAREDLQVHVCPMGVDAEFYGPRRRSASRRDSLLALFPGSGVQKRGVRLLLCVCRISPEKNIRLLPQMMEALGSHPGEEYRLLIAGAGPSSRQLLEVFERCAPGRVRLLGHVGDRERLAEIYANCDALVHPNPREPLGLVPLEAMASGIPVVVPGSGGVLSYACAENSWLALPTADSFAEAVRQVFGNDADRERRVEKALATARRFSWPVVTNRYFDLYDRIVAAPRRTQFDAPLETGSALPSAVCPSNA